MLGLSRNIFQKVVVPSTRLQNISRRWMASGSKSSKELVNTEDDEIDGFNFKPMFPVEETNETMGSYPRTEEDMIKAAKKYNMLREDYKPFPESHGFGDYPDIKPMGQFNRYKYDDYDDMHEMRFYGEPIDIDADKYQFEKSDPLEEDKPTLYPSYAVMFAIFFYCTVGDWFVSDFVDYMEWRPNMPFKDRNFDDDPTHYTFPSSSFSAVNQHQSSH